MPESGWAVSSAMSVILVMIHDAIKYQRKIFFKKKSWIGLRVRIVKVVKMYSWWTRKNSLTIFPSFQIFYCGRMNHHVEMSVIRSLFIFFIFNLGVVVFFHSTKKKRNHYSKCEWLNLLRARYVSLVCVWILFIGILLH